MADLKTLDETLDEIRDVFRDHVLKALDKAALKAFDVPAKYAGQAGATDEDLPRLFKAIDAQIGALCKRYGVY